MTLRRGGPAAPAAYPQSAGESRARSPEIVQREHELNEALTAARALQARLEMLGDRPHAVNIVRHLRDGLATDLAELGGQG